MVRLLGDSTYIAVPYPGMGKSRRRRLFSLLESVPDPWGPTDISYHLDTPVKSPRIDVCHRWKFGAEHLFHTEFEKSVVAGTVLRDTKPKGSFSLNAIILSLVALTSSTERWSRLEMAVITHWRWRPSLWSNPPKYYCQVLSLRWQTPQVPTASAPSIAGLFDYLVSRSECSKP